MINQIHIQDLEILTKKFTSVKIQAEEALFNLNNIENEINTVFSKIKEDAYFQSIENKYDLTKSKDVEKFLDVSRETLRRFRNNKQFIENTHYFIKNEKIIYVPERIIEFKKNYVKNSKKVKVNMKKLSTFNKLNQKFNRKAA